jgi:hypothetical protein
MIHLGEHHRPAVHPGSAARTQALLGPLIGRGADGLISC